MTCPPVQEGLGFRELITYAKAPKPRLAFGRLEAACPRCRRFPLLVFGSIEVHWRLEICMAILGFGMQLRGRIRVWVWGLGFKASLSR